MKAWMTSMKNSAMTTKELVWSPLLQVLPKETAMKFLQRGRTLLVVLAL